MTNVSIPGVNMLKNSSTLAVSVPINLSIKMGFASENGPRETYFVDALCINSSEKSALHKDYFNIFNPGTESFVIPRDQLLYPCVVEVFYLGLEPMCDTHLRLPVILKTLTLTGQDFLEV